MVQLSTHGALGYTIPKGISKNICLITTCLKLKEALEIQKQNIEWWMFNVLENYIRKVESLIFFTFEKLSIETEFSHKYLKGHFFLISVSRGIFACEILKLYKHFENTPDRSSHLRCSVKKCVLRNLQNSQENTCARVSLF